ncbi:MAG: response regulator [Planctomycetes bacterium]|nr:response regulator [Planctomycetota bacterium]
MPNSKRVLIIDDERAIVRGMALRLQMAGYETIRAYDGQQGLTAAIAERPDAIILDICMPNVDGLATLAALRAREETKRIPVVMASGNSADQQVAMSAGACLFLTKPYEGKALVAAMEAAVRDAPCHRANQKQPLGAKFSSRGWC